MDSVKAIPAKWATPAVFGGDDRVAVPTRLPVWFDGPPEPDCLIIPMEGVEALQTAGSHAVRALYQSDRNATAEALSFALALLNPKDNEDGAP